MDKLYFLTDYKGHFGSKHDEIPYRSGMNIELLKNIFAGLGYEVNCIPFSQIHPGDESWKDAIVLYTSSEDPGLNYKQYIEDIVLALTYAGANVIPRFEFLRANNNKVFMELLRELLPGNLKGNMEALHFCTPEELWVSEGKITYPAVIKGFYGASGRNVFLANTSRDLRRIVKRRIGAYSTLYFKIKEHLRQVKHKGYKRDSFHTGRFIVQKFIPGLINDWKVYFFGKRAYVFYRPVFKKRGFRASGGGYDNYKYGIKADIPEGLLDFGWEIFRGLDVPHASFDIAWDKSRFYLLEFQCLYFGTAGVLRKYSSECFLREDKTWRVAENEGSIENVFAASIKWFLNDCR